MITNCLSYYSNRRPFFFSFTLFKYINSVQMVKCVSSAFLLYSTLFFLHCGKVVYVYVHLCIEVDIFSVICKLFLISCLIYAVKIVVANLKNILYNSEKYIPQVGAKITIKQPAGCCLSVSVIDILQRNNLQRGKAMSSSLQLEYLLPFLVLGIAHAHM